MDKDSLEIIKEIAKANAEALYKDAAKPSIRVIGKSLAQCAALFSRPVGRMAEIFEKNIHRYLDKLEGLDESMIVSPNIRVLVPILEKMRFTDEDKVADYYAEILATASKKEHSSKVLVTFIEILNRLTADEIKILEYINSTSNIVEIPELTDAEVTDHGLPKDTKLLSITGSFPISDIRRSIEGQTGYRVLKKNLSYFTEKIKFDSPENIDSYIDNMISLGLIEKKHNFKFAIDKIYHRHGNHPDFLKFKLEAESDPKIKITLEHGRIDITDLGNKLLALCSK